VILAILVLVSVAPAAQANNKPCLCHATMSPMEGSARTVYVASLAYNDPDGDAPAKVEVYIDNVAYPMRLAGGRAANGTYRARLTLPPGEHTYYFYAEDVPGASERCPRYGAWNGPFVGTTKKYNRLPRLTEGGVYFNNGSDRAVYTYTVRYRDMDDCKPPRAVRVAVDGICHDMKLHSGKPEDGIYLYETTLPAGPHAYYFGAVDNRGDCATLPKFGFLRGPDVAEQPNSSPQLTDPKVSPPIGGPSGGRYAYTVVYRDEDGDAPALAQVFVNGFAHTMKLVSGKACDGVYSYSHREHLGNFNDYYFYFEDGRGGTQLYPARGRWHGPVVTR